MTYFPRAPRRGAKEEREPSTTTQSQNSPADAKGLLLMGPEVLSHVAKGVVRGQTRASPASEPVTTVSEDDRKECVDLRFGEVPPTRAYLSEILANVCVWDRGDMLRTLAETDGLQNEVVVGDDADIEALGDASVTVQYYRAGLRNLLLALQNPKHAASDHPRWWLLLSPTATTSAVGRMVASMLVDLAKRSSISAHIGLCHPSEDVIAGLFSKEGLFSMRVEFRGYGAPKEEIPLEGPQCVAAWGNTPVRHGVGNVCVVVYHGGEWSHAPHADTASSLFPLLVGEINARSVDWLRMHGVTTIVDFGTMLTQVYHTDADIVWGTRARVKVSAVERAMRRAPGLPYFYVHSRSTEEAMGERCVPVDSLNDALSLLIGRFSTLHSLHESTLRVARLYLQDIGVTRETKKYGDRITFDTVEPGDVLSYALTLIPFDVPLGLFVLRSEFLAIGYDAMCVAAAIWCVRLTTSAATVSHPSVPPSTNTEKSFSLNFIFEVAEHAMTTTAFEEEGSDAVKDTAAQKWVPKVRHLVVATVEALRRIGLDLTHASTLGGVHFTPARRERLSRLLATCYAACTANRRREAAVHKKQGLYSMFWVPNAAPQVVRVDTGGASASLPPAELFVPLRVCATPKTIWISSGVELSMRQWGAVMLLFHSRVEYSDPFLREAPPSSPSEAPWNAERFTVVFSVGFKSLGTAGRSRRIAVSLRHAFDILDFRERLAARRGAWRQGLSLHPPAGRYLWGRFAELCDTVACVEHFAEIEMSHAHVIDRPAVPTHEGSITPFEVECADGNVFHG